MHNGDTLGVKKAAILNYPASGKRLVRLSDIMQGVPACRGAYGSVLASVPAAGHFP